MATVRARGRPLPAFQPGEVVRVVDGKRRTEYEAVYLRAQEIPGRRGPRMAWVGHGAAGPRERVYAGRLRKCDQPRARSVTGR